MAQLKAQYDAWFSDVTGARDYHVPARIFLGTPHEDPVLLTRQDWRGPGASWGPKGSGYWEVNVAALSQYEVRLRFAPLRADGEATLTCGDVVARQAVNAGEAACVFSGVRLPAGPGRLEAAVKVGTDVSGVQYVEVRGGNSPGSGTG